MKILCITDIHSHIEQFQYILNKSANVDLILLGGDITNFGQPVDVEKIVHLAQAIDIPILAVAGNCDSASIDRRLLDLGVSVAGRGVIIDGVGVHGVSAAPPWHSGMYEFPEEELLKQLEAGYAQVQNARWRVVLAHAPPKGIKLDRTLLFQHAGSAALREFVEKTQPSLVVCGHIHEARGVEMLGRTTVVNCGPARSGNFAIARLGDHVQVDLHQC